MRARIEPGSFSVGEAKPYVLTPDGKRVQMPRIPGERLRSDLWRCQVMIVLPDGTRKPIERWESSKTRAEQAGRSAAEAVLGEFVTQEARDAERRERDLADRFRRTVGEVAAEWVAIEVDGVGSAMTERTRYTYRGVVKRSLTDTPLARTPIGDVTIGRLKDYLRDVLTGEAFDERSDRRRTGGPGMAKTTRSVLKSVFRFAREHGYLESNPMLEVQVPKLPSDWKPPEVKSWVADGDGKIHEVQVVRNHTRALEPVEFQRLYAVAQDSDPELADMMLTQLATGLRIGELLGLTWRDVDIDKNLVRVVGTAQRVIGKGLSVGKTKTRASVRVAPIGHPAVTAMLERRSCDQDPKSPVFPSTAGTHRDPSNTIKLYRRVFDAAGLTWATPHTLRRTLGDWQARAGVSPTCCARQPWDTPPPR